MNNQAQPDSADVDLIRRTATGDREAYNQLVLRHQAAVFRFIRSLGQAPSDAEDTLQETFIAAWRNAVKFRGEGSVRSWLFTIARRLAIRKFTRRPEAERDMVSLEELGAAAGWGGPPSPSGCLDDRLALQQAIQRLSAHERVVLVLRDLEGLTAAEAAEVLGLSIPAIKSRVHRARLHLAAIVRQEATDEG